MILLLLPLIIGLGFVAKYQQDTVEMGLALALQGVAWLLDIILWPINKIIELFIPDFDTMSGYITDMFDLAAQYMGWLLNATMIPTFTLTLVIAYLVFRYSVTFAAWGIKLAIQWKNAL